MKTKLTSAVEWLAGSVRNQEVLGSNRATFNHFLGEPAVLKNCLAHSEKNRGKTKDIVAVEMGIV